jgi:hypothetical protein
VKIAAPKLKGINHIPMERLVKIQDYILGEYEAKFYVNNRTMREAKRYYQATSIKRIPDTTYVYYGDKVPGLKKDYIKSLQPNSHTDALILRKTGSFRLYGKSKQNANYDNYYTILDLKNHPKHLWRAIIKEFQSIINSYASNFINIETLEVPQSFIDARKKQRITSGQSTTGTKGPRRVKLKGEMVCKQATELERWVDGKNCKWVSTTYDMSNFHQNKFILVYGKQEDVDKMDKWFKPTRGMNVELAVLSERELKVVENIKLHNLIPFSKFMEGKNKPFQKIATACFIDQLTDKYKHVFTRREKLEKISTDLYNKVDNMMTYRSKNFKSMNDDIRDIIVEHAKEINGFDQSIYHDCIAVVTICEKLPFLCAMLSNIRYTDDECDILTQALIDLFKYHKHRIDWKNYKIRFNEDLPLEETLTSETVEELVNQD